MGLVPDSPFNPAAAGANMNLTPGQGTLNLSGNASATAYTVWTEKTQNLTGWWERKWKFHHNPLSPSSFGDITGSYIVYHMHETVNTQHTTQTFASGLTVLHDIDYFSNQLSGGWGTSGWLYTTSAGYTRVSGAVGTSGICEKSWDSTGMYLPGTYDLNGSAGAGGTDTSGYWNSTFNQNINYGDCVQQCKFWQPGIVII